MSTEGFVVVTCGSCGTKLKTRPTAEGRTAKCPKCGTLLRLEIPPPPAPPAAPPPANAVTPTPTAPASSAQPSFSEPAIAESASATAPARATTASTSPPATAAPPPTPSSMPLTSPPPSSPAVAPGAGIAAVAGVPGMAAAAMPAVLPTTPNEESAAAAPASAGSAATPARARATSWVKAIILTLAVVVIGAFAWYVAARFGGEALWVVKFSVVAWLIGMGTASSMMAGTGRSGVTTKLASALAGVLAVVLGKVLVVFLIDQPADLLQIDDLGRWLRAFAAGAFTAVDPLFFVMAVAGSAFRFMIARPD